MFNSPKNTRPDAQPTLYWHDYETSGPAARLDRPYQFAGIRTDLNLNEIGEATLLYCRPAEDVLPHPHACVLTGITPQKAFQEGVNEADFADRILQELAHPQTCGVGYNSIKFDDEVTRHLFYRTFRPVYDREWQHGNSRFDLLGLLRLTYVLRPSALKWAFHEDGTPSFKLDALGEVNACREGQAHDALSDVRCTIALAKHVKEKASDLFDAVFNLRTKDAMTKHVKECLGKTPMLHAASFYASAQACVGLVTPLFFHPTRPQVIVVVNLSEDVEELLSLDEEALFERFSRPLEEEETRLPIQLVALNRAPALLSGAWLKGLDLKTIPLDLPKASARHRAVLANPAFLERFTRVLTRISAIQDTPKSAEDADVALYEGFPNSEQTAKINQVRQSSPSNLNTLSFDDSKYDTLLFRYRARNYPESLNDIEQQIWRAHCKKRFATPSPLSLTWEQFEEALKAEEKLGAPAKVLDALKDWERQLRLKLGLLKE